MSTKTEVAFASLSTVLVVLNALVSYNAHMNMHFSVIGRRCYLFPRFQLRNRFLEHRVKEIIFPMILTTLLVPLVQITCVWRAHQDRVASLVVSVTWTVFLAFTVLLLCLSVYVHNMRAYYSHVATVLHLPMALLFMFAGSFHPNPTGDIAMACIYVIVSVLPLMSPPRKVREVEAIVRANDHPTHAPERRSYAKANGASESEVSTEAALESDIERAIQECQSPSSSANSTPRRLYSAYIDNLDKLFGRYHREARRAKRAHRKKAQRDSGEESIDPVEYIRSGNPKFTEERIKNHLNGITCNPPKFSVYENIDDIVTENDGQILQGGGEVDGNETK